MSPRPLRIRQFRKGTEIINYVVYARTTGAGYDQVLQHKVANGTSETAHVTLHPDGKVNFDITRNKKYLEEAIANNLQGYIPSIPHEVREFLSLVREKICGVEQNI